MKYAEQLTFSLINFMIVIVSANLLSSTQYSEFLLIVGIAQGILILIYSLFTNPILVFFPKVDSKQVFTFSILIALLSAPAILISLFAFPLYLLSGVFQEMSNFVYLWAYTALWALFEFARKYNFANGRHSKQFVHTLLLSLLILGAFLWRYMGLTSNIGIFESLLFAQSISLVIVIMRQWPKTLRLSFKKDYLLWQFKYAKWITLTAANIWVMNSGYVLLFENRLDESVFNSLRYFASISGAVGVLAITLEHSLTLKYATIINNNINSISAELKKDMFKACLLGAGLMVTGAVGGSVFAWLFAPESIVENIYLLPLVLIPAFIFCASKPLIALLKARECGKTLFVTTLPSLAVMLLISSGMSFFPTLHIVVAGLIIGPAVMLASVYRGVKVIS